MTESEKLNQYQEKILIAVIVILLFLGGCAQEKSDKSEDLESVPGQLNFSSVPGGKFFAHPGSLNRGT